MRACCRRLTAIEMSSPSNLYSTSKHRLAATTSSRSFDSTRRRTPWRPITTRQDMERSVLKETLSRDFLRNLCAVNEPKLFSWFTRWINFASGFYNPIWVNEDDTVFCFYWYISRRKVTAPILIEDSDCAKEAREPCSRVVPIHQSVSFCSVPEWAAGEPVHHCPGHPLLPAH